MTLVAEKFAGDIAATSPRPAAEVEDDLEELVPVAMGLENASDVLGEHLRIDGMGWGGADDAQRVGRCQAVGS